MVIFVIWIFLSFAIGNFAKNKGLGFGSYFLLSLILSPLIGFIFALVAKPDEAGQVQAGQARKCPFCAEMIRPEATVCRYCHKDLPAYTPPPPPPPEPVRVLTPEEKKKARKGWAVMWLVLLGLIAILLTADYFNRLDDSIIYKVIHNQSLN